MRYATILRNTTRRLSKTGATTMLGERWLSKGFWAVADQGLFATSNFAVNILLARWLTPAEYGAFALAFAVFLFIGSMHQAVLIEPMLVFVPGRYKEYLPDYLSALVYGHVGFAIPGSCALLLAGIGFAIVGSRALSVALFALALAAPFILFLWLMRRMCFARLEPRLAALAGAWYMIAMLTGACLLYWVGWLSTFTALCMMGISSLAAGLWLMARLDVKRFPSREAALARDFLRSHWEYGRWAVANRGLGWIPHNVFYVLLPVWGGLSAGASFRALMNLLMPMLQANSALATLLLPTFVRARERPNFVSQVLVILVPFALASTLYWAVLGIFHDRVISLAYGGRYAENANLLWLLGLVPVVAIVKEVLSQSLRALERPDWLFAAFAVSAVVTVTLGTWFVYTLGVTGAGLGLLLSHGTAAVLVAVMLTIYNRRRGPAGPASAAGKHEGR